MKKILLTFIMQTFLISNTVFAGDYKFMGQDYGPFLFVESGKTIGAMADIVAQMCAITKDNCTVEILPLKRAISSLETGEAHGVVALLSNPDRDSYATFMGDMIKSDMVYFTANDKAELKNVADLKGFTIGAVTASSSQKIATKDAKEAGGDTKVIEDANNETLLKKLANGRYGDKGVILMNEDVMNFISKKEGIKNIKKLFTGKSDTFGIYFSKKSVDQTTYVKFKTAFDQLKSSGELKKILQKYHFAN